MIPVYINVFNRLTTTRNLVDQVAKLKDAQPIIVDNNSTYEPLLEWYEDHCPCEVIRLRENIGHHAPWMSGVVSQGREDWYAVTDCDLDLSGVPADAMSALRVPFSWDCGVIKSGLALRIDDLPHWQSEVVKWESRFWQRPVNHDPRFYHALIDTTFALYRSDTPYEKATQVVGVSAVRLASEYQARHCPWYLDASSMGEEDRQYFATASQSNSWKPSGRGFSSRYSR